MSFLDTSELGLRRQSFLAPEKPRKFDFSSPRLRGNSWRARATSLRRCPRWLLATPWPSNCRTAAGRSCMTHRHAPRARHHMLSTGSRPAGLLHKSFSTRGSSEADHPAMKSGKAADDGHMDGQEATPDRSHASQAPSAMSRRHNQPCQRTIIRSARIASHVSLAITQTSWSCTSSGGTPKFFFAALIAALCFWSGRNAWSPVLCRRTSFGFGGSYPSD